MERLSTEVTRELERLGPGGAIGRVVEVWADAVGPSLAAHAWPARITRDGTLVVHARDSVWAFELTQRAQAIHDRLRDLPVTGVKFVPGPLPENGPELELEPRPERPRPGAAELAIAAELTTDIASPDLRESVSKAIAFCVATGSADRRFW